MIVYILEVQSESKYNPQSIERIYGVFSSPETALTALNNQLSGMLYCRLVWEHTGVTIPFGDVLYAAAELQPFVKTFTQHIYLVPMQLDFGAK